MIDAEFARFHDQVPTEIIEPLLARLGYLPLPLVASITGRTTLAYGATATWSVPAQHPSGGTTPYAFRWAYSLTCNAPPPPPTCSGRVCASPDRVAMAAPTDPCGTWIDGGTARTFTTTASSTHPSMTVRLTVTDAAPTTVQYTRFVTFTSAKTAGDSTAADSSATVTAPVVTSLAGVAARDVDGIPTTYALLPVAPNPSLGRASVRFDVPEASDVSLVVLDVLGREVARLAEGRVEAGTHTAVFDGSVLPVGVYVVRMSASGGRAPFSATRRLTLAR